MSWRDGLKALPNLAPVEFSLKAEATALVIVDMQNMGLKAEYGLGKDLKENYPNVWKYFSDRVERLVLPNTKVLLDAFRSHEMRVIHLTIGPELRDGSDLLPLRRPKTAPGLSSLVHHKGSVEHEIVAELRPLENEVVINKTSRGAFNSTAIERVLLNLGIDSLIVAGVSTSACVETTARDAADRGYQVVVVEDATAEFDRASHEATLFQFVMRWGRVWTTDETLAVLAKLQPTAESVLA